MAGHVRKRGARKDGTTRWEARFPDPLRGGKAMVERSFRSKREAEDWLASQRAAQLQGTYFDARQGDRPFADVIDAWKEGWPNRIAPTTQLRYQGIIDK